MITNVKPAAHQRNSIAIWSDATDLSQSGPCSVPINPAYICNILYCIAMESHWCAEGLINARPMCIDYSGASL